ncbi:MAG: sodium:proton antiporter [Polyangia bacterium]
MSFESAFIALFAIATPVALAAARLRIPYTVALVLVGLGLGATHLVSAPHLTKSLLYAVFLPGLIFEASFHLDGKRFVQNAAAIGALAVPGMLVSAALIAPLVAWAISSLHFTAGFGFAQGLLFAALIVATDPIAVVGLFKTLGVPKRLATLVEGESIFNDGTAVAFYSVVLAATTGTQMSLPRAILDFFAIAGIGLAVGGSLGFVVSRVMRRVDDPMIEITLTTIAAYGSFVAAEGVGASGVIATATAGLICGHQVASAGGNASARLAVHSFWEYVAFGLNSIVFLLIGLEVPLTSLLASWKLIVVAWLIVTVVRALLVFVTSLGMWPTRARWPWAWSLVLGWGGLRGALSMVLALSLPSEFVHRELIVTMTFGVVVISLLVQGLTMSPLLGWLKIGGEHASVTAAELARARLLAARAGLDALRAASKRTLPSDEVVGDIRGEYEQRVHEAEAEVVAATNHNDTPEAQAKRLRWKLVVAEKDALLDSRERGLTSSETVEPLLRACDARLFELERTPDED